MAWNACTITATVSFTILALDWIALELMGLVQGVRFLDDVACNEPLSVYLLTSSVLFICTAISAVITYCTKDIANTTRSLPQWRLDFFESNAKAPHQVLNHARAPVRPQALHNDSAILPMLLFHHASKKHPNGPTKVVAHGAHCEWLPPRSTCSRIVGNTEFSLGPFYATKYISFENYADRPHNAKPPMSERFYEDEEISLTEGQARWRAIDQQYAANGIYSSIPLFYGNPSVLFQRLWYAVGAVSVVLILAWLGVLIWGTVMVSKSGVEVCQVAVYKSALAMVVGNWVIPAGILLFTILPLMLA